MTIVSRRCSYCTYSGLSACITRQHAALCTRYSGPTFTYHWYYVPKRIGGFTSVAYPSHAQFQTALASWQRPGLWEYRETHSHPHHTTIPQGRVLSP